MNNNTNNITENLSAIATALGTLLGNIAASLIYGAILFWLWNRNIAWEFNLPEFGYWACSAFVYVIRGIFKTFPTTSKKD